MDKTIPKINKTHDFKGYLSSVVGKFFGMKKNIIPKIMNTKINVTIKFFISK